REEQTGNKEAAAILKMHSKPSGSLRSHSEFLWAISIYHRITSGWSRTETGCAAIFRFRQAREHRDRGEQDLVDARMRPVDAISRALRECVEARVPRLDL